MLADNFNVDHSTKGLHKKNRIVFHHDNARLHVEQLFAECIANKDWELLQYPPYSPTEAPTHYHINRQANKVYVDFDNLVADVKAWTATSKNREFFVRGIDRLPSKWEAVIEVVHVKYS
ncbi:hypothetical protein CDAR_511241 [Caerostris darwini]|uniref:Transposase n=1 Tax=Caerostris darwini TaxID=1538125 RepID=A0AAV4S775_9ARAC|nr:hypothetical protein CDAR_511241 [Caerostris darwini]